MTIEKRYTKTESHLLQFPIQQALLIINAVRIGRLTEKSKSIELGLTRHPKATIDDTSSETKAQQTLFKLSEVYHYLGDVERVVLDNISNLLENQIKPIPKDAPIVEENVATIRKERVRAFFQKLTTFNSRNGYAPDFTPLEREYWSGFTSYFTGVEEPQLRYIHQNSPWWRNLSFGAFELLYFSFIMNVLTHGVPTSLEFFASTLEHLELESASNGLESIMKLLERGQIIEELGSAWIASRLLPRFGRLDINRLVLDLARNMTELDLRTAESVSASLAKILLLFLLFRFLHLPVAE
jgi:hypothetical protein